MTEAPTAAKPEVLELAQLMYLHNAAWMRRHHPDLRVLTWEELAKYDRQQVQAQWVDIAECGVDWAALHHFPRSAIDTPVATPPIWRRAKARLGQIPRQTLLLAYFGAALLSAGVCAGLWIGMLMR